MPIGTIPVLSAIVYGIVDLIKAFIKAFAPTLDDKQYDVIVRFLAIIVGIVVAIAFDARLLTTVIGLTTVPALADQIASGIALGIGGAIINIFTSWGSAQAPLKNVTATTTKIDAPVETVTTTSPPSKEN